jgi:1-acyl-sn-glycerol-3-phosphate acyltransferase
MAKHVLGDDPFSPVEGTEDERQAGAGAEAPRSTVSGGSAGGRPKAKARSSARRTARTAARAAKAPTGQAATSAAVAERSEARANDTAVSPHAPAMESPLASVDQLGDDGRRGPRGSQPNFAEEYFTYGSAGSDDTTFDVEPSELGAETQPSYGDYGPSLRPREGRATDAPHDLGMQPLPTSRAPGEAAPEDLSAEAQDTPRSGRFRSLTDELLEIEQRVRSRLLPVLWGSSTNVGALRELGEAYRRFLLRRRSQRVDEFGRDPVYSDRVEPMLDAVYSRYFRVELSGAENIPTTGRALLVANHAGALPYDALMLMHGVHKEHPTHRTVRPLVEDATFHVPYLGAMFNRLGAVRACQENGERLLEDGQVVLVFPEGIKGVGKLFRDRYRLQRFGRGGFVKLALRTNAPVLPCAIVGAEETHPLLGRVGWLQRRIGFPFLPITPTFPWLGLFGLVPLPIKWKIRIGKPITLPTENAADRAEDRIFVGKVADQVRQSVQALLDETLASRRSILWG